MSPTLTTSRRLLSSPTQSSWTRRRSSPTKSLLRTPTTMTLHSIVSVRQNGATCGDRAGRPAEQSNQEAQIGTLLDKPNEQILAECQARINKHEFQAACDRRNEELHLARAEEVQTTRSTASSRTIIAAKFGIT